jgi:hypothetical protein
MKLSSTKVSVALCGVFVASLLLPGASSAAAQQLRAPEWGTAVNGLQMAMHLDRTKGTQSRTPRFTVELRNAGERDIVVNLGSMLANGKSQYPSAIALTLTDAHGKSRRLELRGPAGVAGRVDQLVLPIPVGARFAIRVDLRNYWVPVTEEFEIKLKRGVYSIQAQLTGKGVSYDDANLDMKGLSAMPLWQGTVTSNRIRFEVLSR